MSTTEMTKQSSPEWITAVNELGLPQISAYKHGEEYQRFHDAIITFLATEAPTRDDITSFIRAHNDALRGTKPEMVAFDKETDAAILRNHYDTLLMLFLTELATVEEPETNYARALRKMCEILPESPLIPPKNNTDNSDPSSGYLWLRMVADARRNLENFTDANPRDTQGRMVFEAYSIAVMYNALGLQYAPELEQGWYGTFGEEEEKIWSIIDPKRREIPTPEQYKNIYMSYLYLITHNAKEHRMNPYFWHFIPQSDLYF